MEQHPRYVPHQNRAGYKIATLLKALLRRTNDPAIYDHGESEVSVFNINPAGIDSRVIRILHLPPEMSTDAVRRTMGPIQDCADN